VRQVFQHLQTGEMTLADTPAPMATTGSIRIQTRTSLISAGTERMLVEFSQANLLQKARSHPDKVKQVLDKIKTDGLVPTLEAVFRKLDEPLPLGYCNAGVVLECGAGTAECGFKPGDRVLSNGPHAEVVSVPRNLCARIPDGVLDEEAAFTVLGAIALQGIRLAKPTLGERFMVTGLGLIGLITVQLLRANGCEVLGVDLNEDRLRMAEEFGATTVNAGTGADVVAATQGWSRGVGVDAVIITASAQTDDILHQAAAACRKRGRIVLVGVVGLNLRRDDFYKKELTFQVSCSYGPGRYDEKYEQAGQDYPLPYIRWTEQRNFEAVLGAMRSGALNVKPLISHRFEFGQALDAYKIIQTDPKAVGVILRYPETVVRESTVRLRPRPAGMASSIPAGPVPVVSVLGTGNFAKAVLLPALKRTSARLKYVAGRSNSGSIAHAGQKFGAELATTDYQVLLADPEVSAVFIVTSHNSHARLVCEALRAGKHVFVEKPLALNESDLSQILATFQPSRLDTQSAAPLLMVGFNRRFSPHSQRIRQALAGRCEPLCLSMTVNAGFIPSDNSLHDSLVGGGRIIGEGCHFIDLMVFLTGSRVTRVSAIMIGEGVAVRTDKMALSLEFADGSIGTINYFANGSKSYPKELLEVFSEGRVIRMENFLHTIGYGVRGLGSFRTWRQDKGHRAEIALFIDRVAHGGGPLIPMPELANVTRASFAAVESASTGQRVDVPP